MSLSTVTMIVKFQIVLVVTLQIRMTKVRADSDRREITRSNERLQRKFGPI